MASSAQSILLTPVEQLEYTHLQTASLIVTRNFFCANVIIILSLISASCSLRIQCSSLKFKVLIFPPRNDTGNIIICVFKSSGFREEMKR